MKWEDGLRAWLMKHAVGLGYAAVALLGLFLRYSFQPLVVADVEFMNSSWYEAIKAGGIGAISDPSLQFTYSPLHIYWWWLFAKLLPAADTVAVLKATSTLMELALSAGCFALCRALLPGDKLKWRRFTAFAFICLNPILLLNGAGWGQTDASFALFCVLAVLLYLRGKPAWALAALGVALSWKLQAILLLPLFLILYFCGKKRFSLLWFLLVPAIWVVSGLPMALAGQSPLFAVNIYLGQTSLYSELTYNFPNLYALMGEAGEHIGAERALNGLFSRVGVALCVAAIGAMGVWLIARRAKLCDAQVALLGAWCVLCCVFLLPRMHERYGLVGEMLLLCWAVWLGRPRGYAYVLAGALATVSAYSAYMFRYPFFPAQLGGVINLLLLCALTVEVVRSVRESAVSATVRGA